MISKRQRAAFQNGTHVNGQPLSATHKEKLLSEFLHPSPAGEISSNDRPPLPPHAISRRRSAKQLEHAAPKSSFLSSRRTPIRSALQSWFYLFLYTIIHTVFGIYIRLRKILRAIRHRFYAVSQYHHRSPELIKSDVSALNRLPQHLSVIVELDREQDRRSALRKLLCDVGDLTAWCVAAGIPMLTVYERSGILRHTICQTHDSIQHTLASYFPKPACPRLSVRAPNEPPRRSPSQPQPGGASTNHTDISIHVNLISEEDGRPTMVDLTRVLATMVQKNKIKLDDITTELVDAELTDIVMSEPDLLLLFGPKVLLNGYPPWQIRLTEIFHLPDYTEGVSYPIFLHALQRHAGSLLPDTLLRAVDLLAEHS